MVRHIKHGQNEKYLPEDSTLYICSEHFEKDCFERDLQVSFINFCKTIHRNKSCYIFRNFQGKSIWRNSFLVELHVALLKKGFLIDVSCRNISQFFLITFSKSTPALVYWNVLQSFLNFDTSSRWIVSEAAIQRCSLKLVALGPRKMILAKSVINSWKWVNIQYSCN